ncbi:hypothetical protein BGX34_007103 [Mortierella sp. NVP85]|nr:hypothetical protein BGX34_007103 [Mortierella sp. NVP85]
MESLSTPYQEQLELNPFLVADISMEDVDDMNIDPHGMRDTDNIDIDIQRGHPGSFLSRLSTLEGQRDTLGFGASDDDDDEEFARPQEYHQSAIKRLLASRKRRSTPGRVPPARMPTLSDVFQVGSSSSAAEPMPEDFSFLPPKSHPTPSTTYLERLLETPGSPSQSRSRDMAFDLLDPFQPSTRMFRQPMHSAFRGRGGARGGGAFINDLLQDLLDNEPVADEALENRQIWDELDRYLDSDLVGYSENSFEDALETADIDLWADELLEEGMREGLSKLTTPEELDNRSWIYEELRVSKPQRIHLGV